MDKPTNVRPGDRAIIVSSRVPANVGIVVEVVEPYAGGPLPGNGPATYRFGSGDVAWVVESLGRKILKLGVVTQELYREQVTAMADECLRPLRDSDSQDEMVSRVGRAPVSSNTIKPREHA